METPSNKQVNLANNQDSQSWDLKRFIKTLTYFKVIPILSDSNWFQTLMGNPIDRPISKPISNNWDGAIANRIEIDTKTTIETSTETKIETNTLAQNLTLFNFRELNSQDIQIAQNAWGAVDDVVMGGVSQSNISITDSGAIFSGIVSTANSGGFASVRTRNFEPPLNLSQYAGIELRIKGDGQRYKFLLRTESKWDGVGFSSSIDTEAERSITIRIPFSQFIAGFRSKSIAGASLNSAQIYAFQLMLSKFEYDGDLNPKFKTGNFQMQIESINAYIN